MPKTAQIETTGPRSFAKDDTILEDAKKDWKKAVSSEEKQRHREREDLRFQVPDEQWDPLAKQARQGGLVNGVPQMARPMISINKLDQPIQLVLNAERSAQLGINIHPISPDANDETAEVFQGLYRAIERNSQARIARSWAFDRAVKCGRGAYRINTRFDDEGGHPFDQVITIERILHQDCVLFDPAATKPDFSDGEFAFVTSWVTAKEFERLYPKAKATYGADDFVGGTFPDPEWVRGDGEDRAYLVAEYFYKDHEDVEIVLLVDGSVARKDELNGADVVRDERGEPVTRTLDQVTIKWCKLSGAEVLEKQNWNGRYIPLIPVIGKELQPFESERRWVGVIGPAKDAQRMYNYAASSAIEMAALEPKAPFVGAEGQFEGHEAEWGQANNRSFPYLEYKPTTVDGNLSPPPQRMQVDVSRLGPSMQLLQSADQFIQSATAVFDPGLGRQNSKERSGRAILANREQSEAANSHFVQNLADISMPYEARIILDLIPQIYDREGRICQMLDMEDKSEQVMVNAPFYQDPATKRPMAAPEGMAPPLPDGTAPEVKRFDLTKGIYSVDVNVGASYETRMQAGASRDGRDPLRRSRAHAAHRGPLLPLPRLPGSEADRRPHEGEHPAPDAMALRGGEPEGLAGAAPDGEPAAQAADGGDAAGASGHAEGAGDGRRQAAGDDGQGGDRAGDGTRQGPDRGADEAPPRRPPGPDRRHRGFAEEPGRPAGRGHEGRGGRGEGGGQGGGDGYGGGPELSRLARAAPIGGPSLTSS